MNTRLQKTTADCFSPSSLENKEDRQEYARNLRRLRSLTLGEPAIFALGDCHTDLFTYIDTKLPSFATRLIVLQRKGATAYGLARFDSATKSRIFFDHYLQQVSHEHPLLLSFGEVDCNVLIPFRMHKYNSCPLEEVEACVGAYAAYMDHLIASGRTRLIVHTIDPPSQFDPHNPRNTKRNMLLSLRQRSEITAQFNTRLRRAATERGLRLLDLEDRLKDNTTGLVREELLLDDCRAHNLNPRKLAPLVAQGLRDLGFD